MATLVPLEVKYAGDQGNIYGVEGRSNIAVFQVPPISLLPIAIGQAMRELEEIGVTDCVLDFQEGDYSARDKNIRAIYFAREAEKCGLRDSYVGLKIEDITVRTISVLAKGPRKEVARAKELFGEKILGATLDEVIDRIPMQEEDID